MHKRCINLNLLCYIMPMSFRKNIYLHKSTLAPYWFFIICILRIITWVKVGYLTHFCYYVEASLHKLLSNLPYFSFFGGDLKDPLCDTLEELKLNNNNIAIWTNVGAFEGHRWAMCNKEHHEKMSQLIYGAFIFKPWTPSFSFLELVIFVSDLNVFLKSMPSTTNCENINVT